VEVVATASLVCAVGYMSFNWGEDECHQRCRNGGMLGAHMCDSCDQLFMCRHVSPICHGVLPRIRSRVSNGVMVVFGNTRKDEAERAMARWVEMEWLALVLVPAPQCQ